VDVRDRERREPLRQRADQLHAVPGEVEDARRRDREHHGHEHARDGRQHPLQQDDRGDPGNADEQRCRDGLTVRDPLDEAFELRDEAVRVDREAEQLGQLADENRQREPVHVADHRRLGQEIRHEAEACDAADHHDRPDDQPEHRGERHGARRVAVRTQERKDRRRDHRPERGVRAENEDPRGAEGRVAE
jgi:hypothetical protein